MRSAQCIRSGIVSSGNAWERRSQSYFYTGYGVPRKEGNSPLVIRYTFVNTPRLRPNTQFAMLSIISINCLILLSLDNLNTVDFFDLRLYLIRHRWTLQKKHSVSSKIRLFKIQNRKKFREELSPDLFLGGEGTPPPHAPPLLDAAFGASNLEARASFGIPRVLFLGNDLCIRC